MKLLFIILLSSIILPVSYAGSENTAKKYNDIANELYKNEKYTEALKNINYAIELEPGNGAFLRHRGLIYYKQGNLADSAKEFVKAIKLNPNDAMAHYLLASIAGINGQNDFALKKAEKALQLNNGTNKELEKQILSLINALKDKI